MRKIAAITLATCLMVTGVAFATPEAVANSVDESVISGDLSVGQVGGNTRLAVIADTDVSGSGLIGIDYCKLTTASGTKVKLSYCDDTTYDDEDELGEVRGVYKGMLPKGRYHFEYTSFAEGYWSCSIYIPEGCAWTDDEYDSGTFDFTWTGRTITIKPTPCSYAVRAPKKIKVHSNADIDLTLAASGRGCGGSDVYLSGRYTSGSKKLGGRIEWYGTHHKETITVSKKTKPGHYKLTSAKCVSPLLESGCVVRPSSIAVKFASWVTLGMKKLSGKKVQFSVKSYSYGAEGKVRSKRPVQIQMYTHGKWVKVKTLTSKLKSTTTWAKSVKKGVKYRAMTAETAKLWSATSKTVKR